MRKVLIAVSFIGIILTALPAFFVLTGGLTQDENKILMLVGTICWFISAPYWLNKKEDLHDSRE